MTARRHRVSLSERLFAALLRLFPVSFRDRFGQDMRELFRDQVRAARVGDGARGVFRLWVRVFPSLFRAASLERGDATRGAIREFRTSRRTAPSAPTRSDSMLETLAHDLRFAIRMLRRSPVFAVVAVVIISLGSGAVTTIFSGINAVVLRPLPGTSNPDRLFMLERRTPDFDEGVSGSNRYYRHLSQRARTIDGAAAWSKASLSISVKDQGHAVYGNIVSGNYFSVLGERPALGRFFAPDEDRTPLANPVLVVSHDFWETTLGADTQRHRANGRRERPPIHDHRRRHEGIPRRLLAAQGGRVGAAHDAGAGAARARPRRSAVALDVRAPRAGCDARRGAARAGRADDSVGARRERPIYQVHEHSHHRPHRPARRRSARVPRIHRAAARWRRCSCW